jgi:hypothetical protein
MGLDGTERGYCVVEGSSREVCPFNGLVVCWSLDLGCGGEGRRGGCGRGAVGGE